jgi:outer membrane protein insertion porin family
MSFRTVVLTLAMLVALAASVRAQAPTAPIVKQIDIQYAGANLVSKEKILANMRTRVGKPYDERAVEEDIRNIYATGNISNVRIFGEPAADGVKVIVVVQPKAQIREVTLSGVTRFKESRIRKEISAKPGDALSEASLEADRQKVLDYYASKGFGEADVSYKVEADEKVGTARVSFTVNEGGKMAIKSVIFEGNTAVKESELKKAVKSKPKGLLAIFSKAGRLDQDLLQEDVRALQELYQSKGYVDVEVSQPRIDRQDGKVTIVFPIKEGLQYHVGKVDYVGAQVFTKDELAKGAKIQSGEIYSPQNVRADIKRIQDIYGTRGYIDFQAGADVNASGKGLMDVTYRVEEGLQSYVEHIDISGNTRTKDKVIRREIALAPGDLYNTVRVDASKERLKNLNYFSKVDTFPSDTLVPGRKDLKVLVEEKRTGSFNFGAGFSSIDSLIGFAEITQGNFDIMRWPYFTGGGQKFRLRVQWGTRRKDFILSLTEPYFLDYRLSVGGELFFRDASFVSAVYDERRYGFDLHARKFLNEFTYVRFGYTLQDVDIHDVDPDASQQIKDEEGNRLESKLYGGITFDTRDSVFLTRRGHKIDLQTYVAGGFLGGDTDIYGFDLEASKYFLLPWDTILILNAEAAVVQTWAGGDRVPIFDRLFLGGANNLRGFKYRDVGPKDTDDEPVGGNTLARLTVEYTFPVVEKVRGALFYDVGFVNEDSYDFGSGNINSDVGIGVRLDLPIGPVRIDYGIPIQTQNNNSGSGKFNFNIGYQF